MAHPLVSKKRAKALATSLFLLGLAILSYLGQWWPGFLLVIGIPIALRELLLGRPYDMLVSLIIFVGAFSTVQFELGWKVVLPVIFTIGAIYVFFRDYVESTEIPEEEREEDINLEIEEEKKKR